MLRTISKYKLEVARFLSAAIYPPPAGTQVTSDLSSFKELLVSEKPLTLMITNLEAAGITHTCLNVVSMAEEMTHQPGIVSQPGNPKINLVFGLSLKQQP